jgi:cell division protein FtsB
MIKVGNKTYSDSAAAWQINMLERKNKRLKQETINLKDKVELLRSGANGLLLFKIHCQYTTGCRDVIDYVRVENGVASIDIVFDIPEPKVSVNIKESEGE